MVCRFCYYLIAINITTYQERNMKKIYLLILLVVSMSFGRIELIANWDEQTTPEGSIFVPNFRISSQGAGVNGFKVYAYFSNDEAGEVPNLAVTDLNGAKSITIEPKSSHVYRVVLDFSNTKIPANGYFPSYSGHTIALFDAYINKANVANHALRPYPWGKNFHNIVVESKDGKVLFGKHPNLSSRVGILSKSGCNNSGGFYYSDKKFWDAVIRINSEKKDNKSKISGPQPHGVSVSGRDVSFEFCIYEYDELPKVSYDYVVLRMDEQCPVGSYSFRRHHDTEDSYGSNFSFGPLWPSSVGSNVDLEFCFVPRDPKSTRMYPFDELSSNTSIFANVSRANLALSSVHVDDEDSDNENSWYYYGLSKNKANEKAIIDRIQNIMSGGNNTTYFIVTKVNSSLSKSAAEVADAPISAGETLVAAVPHAPAIKGLNRSAVSVELKSEGNVKVSIVNANGSVIANIAQENLQAGVHQIKWNSGMVPSGRYIVKVEQNGMVNARNVVLK